MGRKLKYRDVVGGGNRNKNNKNIKNQKFKKKSNPSFNKTQNNKRKTNYNKNHVGNKRLKVEQIPQIDEPIQPPPPSPSSSEESEPDEWEKFMSWGDPKYSEKRRIAIETSSDSSDDESDNDDEPTAIDSDDAESDANQENDNETSDHDDNEINIEEDVETNQNETDDPFVKHISYDLHENLLKSLQHSPPLYKTNEEKWPKLGRLVVQIPQYVEEKLDENQPILAEKRKFAPSGTSPHRHNYKTIKPSDLFIKTQIVENLKKSNVAVTENDGIFTEFQSELFSIINNYQDLCYNERNFENSDEIRFVYCLHTVNHILKTRLKVIHHNARLTSQDDVPDEFRDQGLIRPKVLIVVPFRDSAYKIIQTIISILLVEDKGNVVNKKRFIGEFTGNELYMPKKHPKPDDYVQTFTGNTGDDFRIGLSVTKKSIKLFADFYSSDIIVASPLGLRTIIGAEGESTRDHDFLASIELLIMDQTDLFLVQNWDHIFHLFKHLHLQPKSLHGTNLLRVRNWALEGHAKYYRQTLIFSSIMMANINNLFNRCHNFAGRIKIENPIEFGCINEIVVKLPHVFKKFDTSSLQQSSQDRLEFFLNKILPQHTDTVAKQTLIFVPSYFDFVRLRNRFNKDDVSFVQICEYSQEKKVARARDMFFHGDAHFLLYTERFHFFNRIRVKGIRHVIFYQPPNFPHFYAELCNLMTQDNMNRKIGHDIYMTVTVLYCKYDIFQMYGIVGSKKTNEMLASEQNSHAMVTGDG